jgi:hypothetical protein
MAGQPTNPTIDLGGPRRSLARHPRRTCGNSFEVPIPWADSPSEVQEKALLFFLAGSPLFYIFQDYGTDGNIMTTSYLAGGTAPGFPGRQLITGESRIDLIIRADGPSAEAAV